MRIAILGGDSRSAKVHWPVGYDIRIFPGKKWDGNGSTKRLRAADASGSLDGIVALTKWISHSETTILRHCKTPSRLWAQGIASLAEELPTMFPLKVLKEIEMAPVRKDPPPVPTTQEISDGDIDSAVILLLERSKPLNEATVSDMVNAKVPLERILASHVRVKAEQKARPKAKIQDVKAFMLAIVDPMTSVEIANKMGVGIPGLQKQISQIGKKNVVFRPVSGTGLRGDPYMYGVQPTTSKVTAGPEKPKDKPEKENKAEKPKAKPASQWSKVYAAMKSSPEKIFHNKELCKIAGAKNESVIKTLMSLHLRKKKPVICATEDRPRGYRLLVKAAVKAAKGKRVTADMLDKAQASLATKTIATPPQRLPDAFINSMVGILPGRCTCSCHKVKKTTTKKKATPKKERP